MLAVLADSEIAQFKFEMSFIHGSVFEDANPKY